MKKIGSQKFFLSLGLVFLIGGTGRSLEIPLTGGVAGEAQRIAYVDMDKIFEIFPATRYAKEDYMERLDKKKEVLQAKEQELNDLKQRINVLESTLAGGEIPSPPDDGEGEEGVDPVSPAPNAGSLESLKSQMQVKKAELEDEKKLAREELEKFQAQQSEIILGKIYQALKILAEERQVNLVVDKSSILFGSTEIDLTEDLQERVRGY